MSGDILVSQLVQEMLQASGQLKPGMLLNILECADSTHKKEAGSPGGQECHPQGTLVWGHSKPIHSGRMKRKKIKLAKSQGLALSISMPGY